MNITLENVHDALETLERYEEHLSSWKSRLFHVDDREIHSRINNLRDTFNNCYKEINENNVRLIKDNQELWGHIHILEEQQEIMHNFLVEINKYLVSLADKDK